MTGWPAFAQTPPSVPPTRPEPMMPIFNLLSGMSASASSGIADRAIVAAPAAFRKSRREFRGVFFFMGNLLFGTAYIKAADAYVQAAAAISQIPAPVME